MNASIKAIEYYLPEAILTNEYLSSIYPDWSATKIFEKTGINERHIASENEFVSDLAYMACQKLFNKNEISPEEIDFILLATQSPDYLIPTTACMLQEKLGISKKTGAIDINLGCSAFVYGLGLSKALISSGISKNVLLIMSETYSKHIHPMDKSARTIFGDAAAATIVSTCSQNKIGDFVFGTDGSGAESLMIPASCMKGRLEKDKFEEYTDENGSMRTKKNLYMDGPSIFNFTIKEVPKVVNDTLIKNNLEMDDIDLFVFHQANKYMLEYLRKKMKIPQEKFYINIENIGNTVSASIPIALKMAEIDGTIKKDSKIMLVGFGVGLSWGATIINF